MYEELIERLKSAEGADRDIDRLLADELEQCRWSYVDCPTYTSSLDAALALVEAKLPGWIKGFRQHDDIEGSGWFVWLNSPDYKVECWTAGDQTKCDVLSGLRVSADAPTPTLALCIALIEALEHDGLSRAPSDDR